MDSTTIKTAYDPPVEKRITTAGRIKNMFLSPKSEWEAIAGEKPDTLTDYLNFATLPIIVSAAAIFIGQQFISRIGLGTGYAFGLGVLSALQAVFIGTAGVWLSAYAINLLAPGFGAERNFGRALQLIMYSMIPIWAGSLSFLFPPLGYVFMTFAIYGFYFFYYVGIPVIMKIPDEKITQYMVISSVIIFLINFALIVFYFDILRFSAGFLGSMECSARPDK